MMLKVFAAPGAEDLVKGICGYLQDLLVDKNINPGEVKVTIFDNENMEVQVEEVRGCFVVVVCTQTTPVDKNLTAFLLMLDAIQNASAAGLLVVFSYMFYARSDSKKKSRISVGGPMLARTMNRVLGVKKVILLDPHDDHMRNIFEPCADSITAIYLLADYLKKTTDLMCNPEKYVLVFADSGSAKRFDKFADFLGIPVAYINKRREIKEVNIKQVVGDVQDKICVLIDDESLSGGTIIKDANILLENKAKEIIAILIHGALNKVDSQVDVVIKSLEVSNLSRIIVTDSIPIKHKLGLETKFEIVSVSNLLANAIQRVYLDKSLSYLHKPENVRLYHPAQLT